MARCPNINLPEWQQLVAAKGEDLAYFLWDNYNGDVPPQEYTDVAGFNSITPRVKELIAKMGVNVVELQDYAKENPDIIAICEGYATGKTIHDLNNAAPVVVAFDASNLVDVAEAMRKKYPESAIVVMGDDDEKTRQKNLETNNKDFNPGKYYADKAAKAVDGTVSLPNFPVTADREKNSDWNDLRVNFSKEEACPTLA